MKEVVTSTVRARNDVENLGQVGSGMTSQTKVCALWSLFEEGEPLLLFTYLIRCCQCDFSPFVYNTSPKGRSY
jgi:hypothetical protein